MHLGNWIRATSVTTGTGALALSSVSGYAPPSSQFPSGLRFQYALLDNATGEPAEGGIGYLDASGNLIREIPQASMAGGSYAQATAADGLSPVSLTGTTRVICTPLAFGLSVGPKRLFDCGVANDNMFTQSNFVTFSAGTLNAQAANRLLAWDAVLDFSSPIDAVSVKIGTTGGNADICLYEVLPNGMPGDLLIGWQNVTLTASAVMVFTFAAATHGPWSGGPRMIPPGRYKLAINASAAISFAGFFTVIDGTVGFSASSLGAAYLSVMRAAGTNNQGVILETFPSAAPTITSFNGSSGQHTVPAVCFRRAP